MTKAVRLSFATDWRCDRAVVAAAAPTQVGKRPATTAGPSSSLVGLSHNLLAQRTQSRTADPLGKQTLWKSAGPRHPEEALRRPAAAAEAERRQRMAAATYSTKAPVGDEAGDIERLHARLAEEKLLSAPDMQRLRDEVDIHLPQEAGRASPPTGSPAAPQKNTAASSLPINVIEIGSERELALDWELPPGALMRRSPPRTQRPPMELSTGSTEHACSARPAQTANRPAQTVVAQHGRHVVGPNAPWQRSRSLLLRCCACSGLARLAALCGPPLPGQGRVRAY